MASTNDAQTPLRHLATLPDRRAAADPDGACLDDDRTTLTNRQFLERVDATAALLARHRIGPGAVVGTVLTNRSEFVIVMFATWRLGAALTPVNPALTPSEVAFQLRDAGASVVVHEADIELDIDVDAIVVAALPTGPDDPGSVGAQGAGNGPDPDALALLIYTSGTTGQPKGVMLDHANLGAMVEMIVKELRLNAAHRCLLILPLFHVNGIVVSVLSPLASGGTTSISARFSASTFFDTVEALRPTYFSAVPTIFAMLTALPADIVPDTSSIEFAVCGAAPMPAEMIHRFEDRFGIPIVEGYGLSECTCAATFNPIDGPRKAGTVGRPFDGVDVALLGADGQPTRSGTGEVLVRGPNVMRGYLNRRSDTADALRDGWLHTGDVGHFDDEGYLVLVDRVKDMIIRGGENIYPKEIENVLYRHPAVLEAAVVGRPHDVLGEEVVAFVSLRENTPRITEELQHLCDEELPRFKRPTEILVLEGLPKNAVGKLAKPAMRELLEQPRRADASS